MRILRVAGAVVLLAGCVVAESPRVLVSWDFTADADKAWTRGANHSKDVRIEDGVLKGTMTSWDPFVTSPKFSIEASAGQAVEMRVRTSTTGPGNIYWIPEGAAGAQAKWNTTLMWAGGGEWREYRVFPYWQGEKRIAQFRIDFSNPADTLGTYEVDWVRVVDAVSAKSDAREWRGAALSAWRAEDGAVASMSGDALVVTSEAGQTGRITSPMLSIPSYENVFVSVEMAADTGDDAIIYWASSAVSGLHQKRFRIKTDGKFHTYNVDMTGIKEWIGDIVLLKVMPVVKQGASAHIRAVAVCDEPQGAADVSVLQARLSDAINRAGRPLPLLIQLANMGGQDAKNLKLAVKKMPRGLRIVSAPGWEKVEEVSASAIATHMLLLTADRALKDEVVFTLTGDGADGLEAVARVEVLPDLKQPKAAYVPVPQPIESDYEIGALYYPGWQSIERWARIWPVAPERKPVLGWYDETNPEVVDWQIKWAVENGLSYFLVDWYWHKGSQYNDHWVKAFQCARYKSFLKWAVMWANHNAAGSHSVEDQRAVTRFWIENYFNTPEYYRIDDKPVVMIWSAQNMNRDLGDKDGCKRLLELSRKMAVEAGFKGITFIAMKWPEASFEPAVVQGYKDMGFDMTSIYHYMHHGGKAENPRRFSFDLVADSNYDHWKGLHATGILPFLPNLSTGWDDRPWHGDRGTEIYGRTVEHFRRICRDAKRFADETGIKRMTLAPLNEWGEGSYAEPNAEFGFGMYEAVRETFCKRPATGWPLNYGPQDVGLGPYDLPMPPKYEAREWSFVDGPQGWYALMGTSPLVVGAHGLSFTTTSRDPAIGRAIKHVPARQVARIVVRMKVAGTTLSDDTCQLFWHVGGAPANEEASIRKKIVSDGAFHDYVFEVGGHRRWRGLITQLRFDPIGERGASVTVESIRMLRPEEP